MTTAPEPISNALADRMVRQFDPCWTVVKTTAMQGGHHPVATVVVETTTDRRRYVLKSTRADGQEKVATEARVLRLLATQTMLPVPDVVGAVDEHVRLPAPFFLMERLPGTKHPRTEMDALDSSTLSTIARSAGRQLAELHRFDAVDAFGLVTHRRGEPLRGGQPRGTADHLTLDEPFEDWSAAVRRWTEQALDVLSGGRFDDLRTGLRAVIEPRIDRLDDGVRPVLAHIDWSLDNLVLDPATHAVTGLPDWEFTVAATRGYDLVYAVHSLSGGPWSWVPTFPDSRESVRDGLVAGYQAVAPDGALAEYQAHRETYALLNTMHAMIHGADRLELDGATSEQIDGAAARLREHAGGFL